MLILGLDYETCGSPEKPPFLPTELGMVLVDTPSYRVIQTQTFLIDPGVPVGAYFLDLTHLTQEQISSGIPRAEAAERLFAMLFRADAVLTWNGNGFDDRLAMQEINAFIDPEHREFSIPWVDLKLDAGFDHKLKLTHAAADLGYLNPQSHSALGDVLTLFEVARRKNFDFATAIYNAQFPYVEVLAQVSFDTKDQANQAGYRWAPDRKIWVRKIRENLIPQEAAQRPFIVSRVAETVKELSQPKGLV